tara:strand:+ start:2236 stop:2754 length:519 start_codon:yes stop_codon:yes gene_type:complete
MNLLVIYSSTDGHTKIICEKIIQNLENSNNTELVPLERATNLDLSKFDKILIGASIRYGKHSNDLYKFIKSNKKILDQKETAFFSVNVVARKIEKSKPETNPYIKKFLKISNWKPSKVAVFAGKVDYPNYKFFDKYAIKLIMFITKGPTDTTRSYEFTNWSKVEAFAKELRF